MNEVTGVVEKRFDGRTAKGKPFVVITVGEVGAFCWAPSKVQGIVEGTPVKMAYTENDKGTTLNTIEITSPTSPPIPVATEEPEILPTPIETTPTPAVPQAPTKDPYEGLAIQSFDTLQKTVLKESIAPEDVSIKPTGEVYYDQMKYRLRLNRAFGAGAWGLRPIMEPREKDGEVTCGYDLLINGRFVARAYGSQKWYPNNPRMTRADAIDSTKSDALKKCCKDIGIATECWDKPFIAEFKKKYCVLVKINPPDKGMKSKWRRKNTPPFDNEVGEIKQETQQAEEAEVIEEEPPKEPTIPQEIATPKEIKQREVYHELNQAFVRVGMSEIDLKKWQKKIDAGTTNQLDALLESFKGMGN